MPKVAGSSPAIPTKKLLVFIFILKVFKIMLDVVLQTIRVLFLILFSFTSCISLLFTFLFLGLHAYEFKRKRYDRFLLVTGPATLLLSLSAIYFLTNY